MSFVANWRIGVRLTLVLGTCILLLAMVAGIAAQSLTTIQRALEVVTQERYAALRLAHAAQTEADKQAELTRSLLLVDTAAERQRELAAIQQARQAAAVIFQALDQATQTDAGRAQLRSVADARARYRGEMATYLDQVTAGQLASARQHLLGRVAPVQREYLQALAAFTRYQESLMQQASDEARASVRQSLLVVVSGAVLACGLAIVLGWLLTRSITRPMAAAVRLAQTVATGDLSTTVVVQSRDETGQLLAALRDMNQGLARVVAGVRASSDSIATGSAQIAAGNADLSQRTEEQAANLQQTAASMEELTATVQQNAETAQRANQVAAAASTAAEQGGRAVASMAATMQQIAQASRQIADITSVIDGIAFQTNILALNASVEAARAGDQGRGFAVVAQEVRTLAQRSAQAAREIKALIGVSADKVEQGSTLAGAASARMDDIVAQVQRVGDLMSEISASSAEQSTGIAQVGDAVAQLDQVTQQNAALVEQSASASESLSHQATRLAALVSTFRIPAGVTA